MKTRDPGDHHRLEEINSNPIVYYYPCHTGDLQGLFSLCAYLRFVSFEHLSSFLKVVYSIYRD